ncbi:serine hydrolase domain-containing protein, partial [Microcoleus sp. Pol11C3]|uniref:serine hydrolase domain-containing protein n=1 Tax=Microcoleus sp. Pol11C3 TaxID=3055390 RepID=UPI002FD4CA0D
LHFILDRALKTQATSSAIDIFSKPYLSKREKLALTIGVIDKGHHYIKAFGKLSNTAPAVPNANTIYEIGSVTKVFTVTVLAKLVNDGNVELDAPIRLYLPVEVINHLNPAVQSITLQQLATPTWTAPFARQFPCRNPIS